MLQQNISVQSENLLPVLGPPVRPSRPAPEEREEEPHQDDCDVPSSIEPATDNEKDEDFIEQESDDFDYALEIESLLGRLENFDRMKLVETLAREKWLADIGREFDFDGDREKIRYDGFIRSRYLILIEFLFEEDRSRLPFTVQESSFILLVR